MAGTNYLDYDPTLHAADYPITFTSFFTQLTTDVTTVENLAADNAAYILGIANNGIKFNDGVALTLGTSNDTTLSHTGTETLLFHSGTGDLKLTNTANIIAIGDTYVNILDNIALNFGNTQEATIRYDLTNTELDITSTKIHLTGATTITGATDIIGATDIDGILSISSFLNIQSSVSASLINSVSGNMSIQSNGTVQIGYTSLAVNLAYAGATKLSTSNTGITVNGSINGLNTKIINIGTWNMDSTQSVNVPHGIIDESKVRSIQIGIRDDAASHIIDINARNLLETTQSYFRLVATMVLIVRADNGYFDNTTYATMGDDGNRGWITIQYID